MQSCSTVLCGKPLLCLPGNTNKWPHRRLLPKASISLENITQAILGPTTHAWGLSRASSLGSRNRRNFLWFSWLGMEVVCWSIKGVHNWGPHGSLRLAFDFANFNYIYLEKSPLKECIYIFAILVIDKVFEHLISYWYPNNIRCENG